MYKKYYFRHIKYCYFLKQHFFYIKIANFHLSILTFVTKNLCSYLGNPKEKYYYNISVFVY